MPASGWHEGSDLVRDDPIIGYADSDSLSKLAKLLAADKLMAHTSSLCWHGLIVSLDSVVQHGFILHWAGKMTKALSIGQIARQAGLGVETVRSYERQGLLSEPARRKSGYRQYTKDALIRLRFIKRAKKLGFSLKEIAELITLHFEPDTSCPEVMAHAQATLTDIQARIRDLNKIKKVLHSVLTDNT